MVNLFDLLGRKKQEAARSTADSRGEWQQFEQRMAQIVDECRPVLEEYRRSLAARNIDARLSFMGPTAFRLTVPLRWTFGIVALEQYRFSVYMESDPARSYGYAKDDLTQAVQPPSLPDQWAGPATLRALLDRALQLFIERFDRSALQSGAVGP